MCHKFVTGRKAESRWLVSVLIARAEFQCLDGSPSDIMSADDARTAQ
jgi:hypothetical protein